jgi:outer membrane biosynthesis protein TonB
LTPSNGLVIVRIAWLVAVLVGLLAILVGLLSGTDGGDSSRGSPQAAFAPGFAFEAQEKAESTRAAAPREDRNQRAKGQIPGESHPGSDAPGGSAGQPGDAGGSEPVVTPQPEPTPAPRPEPTPAPRPKPTPTPPQIPVSSQPAAPEPVQPPAIVANNNDGP